MIFSKSEIKLYTGVLGKRDKEDKILICFHEHDFVAYVTAEGDSNFHYGKVTNGKGRNQIRNPVLGPDNLPKIAEPNSCNLAFKVYGPEFQNTLDKLNWP